MEIDLVEQYFLAAQNFFQQDMPVDWEKLSENINLALSYNPEHVPSICMLGYINAEFLNNPQKAFACFDKAIELNPKHISVYQLYAEYLVKYNKIDRAKKILHFALDKNKFYSAKLYWTQAILHEKKFDFDKSLYSLRVSKMHCIDSDFFIFLGNEEQRVIKKINLLDDDNKHDENEEESLDLNQNLFQKTYIKSDD